MRGARLAVQRLPAACCDRYNPHVLSRRAAARDVLLEAEIVRDEPVAATPPSRVLGVLLGVLAVGALVIWLGTEFAG
jgi:hypothetical protein